MTFVQSWDYNSGVTSLTSTSVTVSGASANNLLVAVLATRAGGPDDIAASGWTELSYDFNGSGGGKSAAAFYRIASGDSSDNFNPAWTLSCRVAISIAEFSGLATSTPLEDNTSFALSSGLVSSVATGTATPVTANGTAISVSTSNEGWYNGANATIDGSYSIHVASYINHQFRASSAIASLDYTSTSGHSATWTKGSGTSGGVTAALMAVFKAAGGGTTGSAVASLAALTGSASGSVVDAFTGTGSGLLQALTGAASGNFYGLFNGTGSANLAAVEASASGSFASGFAGTASASLDPVSGNASGTLVYSGDAAAALAAISGSASGSFTGSFTGSASASLAAVAANAAGVLVYAGAGEGDLPTLIASSSGSFSSADFAGVGAVNLAALTAASTGVLKYSGSASATLSQLEASASGTFTASQFIGAAVAALAALTGAATGAFDYTVSGTGAGQLVAVTAASTGKLVYVGTASALLAEVVALATESQARGSIRGASNLVLISKASNLNLISNN